MVVKVELSGPASLVVQEGDVLLAVNGERVHDAATASRAIQVATLQSTTSGKILPVRLLLGRLTSSAEEELDSPKGIEADFGLELIVPREATVMRMPPPGINDVVQAL